MASYGGAAPYRSREGLNARPASGAEEIQLRIDPLHYDFDDKVTGLRTQVQRMRNIAEEISTEAKLQDSFLDQVQMTMAKAHAGVKNNVRRLNKSIVKNGSNSVVHVILFALVLFFLVYFLSKLSRK